MRYQSGNISIDDDFARFGEKSCAINKITSVEITTWRRPAGCLAFTLLMVGITALAVAAAAYAAESATVLTPSAITAGVCCLCALWLYTKPRLVDYHLVLTTSSSGGVWTTSTDAAEIKKIRDAVEAAMMAGKRN